jgi:hypothetical protein
MPSPATILSLSRVRLHDRTVPRWDAQARALTFGGRLVKRFRQRASHQERVLAVS